MTRISKAFLGIAALGLLLPGDYSSAQEVVSILSSESRHYREASDSFQKALGKPVPTFILSGDTPRISTDTKVAVAFGGKAAMAEYPGHVIVISCLAPGVGVDFPRRKMPHIRVSMLPHPRSLLSTLTAIQPALKVLVVYWASESMRRYVKSMEQEAALRGIEIVGGKLDGPGDFPARLRRLPAQADAIWLAPDPLLVNAQSFATLKDFSWANGVPFYAPTAGLVDKGATASVSVGFDEIGRVAAEVARNALAGRLPDGPVHPDKAEVAINLTAARNVHLAIPPGVMKTANRVAR
ncbi:MAG: ABC transporter substrate binding protein [Elusimicrobiota bacterium]